MPTNFIEILSIHHSATRLSPDAFRYWNMLTNFGDAAIILPFSCFIIIMLWWNSGIRHAYRWGLGSLISCCLLGSFKLLFLSCGSSFLPSHMTDALHSPSGHMGMSTAVYGGIAVLLLKARPIWLQWSGGFLTLIFLLAMGTSRVVLGCHTLLEVIIGFLIGTSLPITLMMTETKTTILSKKTALIFIIMLGWMTVNYGENWHLEDWIRAQVGLVRSTITSCQKISFVSKSENSLAP